MRWSVGAGSFEVVRGAPGVLELSFEIDQPPSRLGFLPERFALRPIAGVAVTGNQGVWIFAGVRRDWTIAPGWTLSPSVSIVGYNRGNGKNLGGSLQFRSFLEISRSLHERFRVGLALYHLSNARIRRYNPGSESILITFSAPVEGLRR